MQLPSHSRCALCLCSPAVGGCLVLSASSNLSHTWQGWLRWIGGAAAEDNHLVYGVVAGGCAHISQGQLKGVVTTSRWCWGCTTLSCISRYFHYQLGWCLSVLPMELSTFVIVVAKHALTGNMQLIFRYALTGWLFNTQVVGSASLRTLSRSKAAGTPMRI